MQWDLLKKVEGLSNMPRDSALQKIESHEKLCRIMQKQTHDRINQLQTQITRIERILLVSMGSVMTGMAGVIIVLIQKL
jgi:cell division protein FtsL